MRGFTLIETMLALAIISMLLAITLPVGWDLYTSEQLRSERDTLVAFITRSRTLALINNNSAPHGLSLGSQTYTIFQGASFASRSQNQDQNFPRTQSVHIAGPSEIVFTPLSGETSPTTFALNLAGKTLNITVNTEGMIDY